MPDINAGLNFEKRLASYGAMSLAVATGFMAPSAEAATINTYTANKLALAGSPLYFDPATGASGSAAGTLAFELIAFSSFNHLGGNPGNPICQSSSQNPACMSLSSARITPTGVTNHAAYNVAETNGFATKFAFGAALGTAALGSIQTSGILFQLPNGGQFAQGQIGYIGLYETGHYGWAEVEVMSQGVELISFAYDTSGLDNSLTAGETGNTSGGGGGGSTPEPSTLLLMALGATGIAALRRRSQTAASE